MKTIATTLCVALVLGMGIHIASSDDLPPSHTGKGWYMVLANEIGTKEGSNIPLMKVVVRCESSWDNTAINYRPHAKYPENSVGLVQLNLIAHTDITKQEAENPIYSLTYLAKGLSTDPNQWSCYKRVKSIK